MPGAAAEGPPFVGTAKTALDGSFAVYGVRAAAGLKPGRYVVTLAAAAPLVIDPKAKPRAVAFPEKFTALHTTPWKIEVKADATNRFELSLDEPKAKD